MVSDKMSARLILEIANWRSTIEGQSGVSGADDDLRARSVDIFVTFDGEQSRLEAAGLRIGSVHKGLATGSVRLADIDALADLDCVREIEFSGTLHPQLDQTMPEMHVDQVWNAPPSATGKGVIIGIIDTGINVYQAAFRTAARTTRILAVWDQNLTKLADPANTVEQVPQPFAYGVEYTRTAIDSVLANTSLRRFFRHNDTEGHGTFVTHCAAGNGRSFDPKQTRQFVGAAPDADIVFVRLKVLSAGPTTYSATYVTDAIRYIFAIGEAESKPVVINFSQGENLTPSDGSGPLDKAIDSLLFDANGDPVQGRIFVAAAGNEGDKSRHSRKLMAAGGNLTFTCNVAPIGGHQDDLGGDFMEVWYDDPMSLDISIVPPGTAPVGPVPPGPPKVTPEVTVVSKAAAASNGRKNISIALKPVGGAPIKRGAWQLKFHETGNQDGAIDIWIGRKDGDVYPQFPTADMSRYGTVTSPATAASAIAVGAYHLKSGMAFYSSWGPFKTDGWAPERYKPTVCAPGAVKAPVVGALAIEDLFFKVGNMTVYWSGMPVARLPGTSFSAPQVAGVVALMLERNPKLTHKQVMQILQQTARTDIPDVVGFPNSHWGGGKVNARAAVSAVPP